MTDVEMHSGEPQRYSGEGWDDLAQDADEVLGYDLAKEELLDALVGVPFIITQVNFRPGVTRKTDKGNKQFAFVSCECRISMSQAQADIMNAARVQKGLDRITVPVIRLPKLNMARKAADLPELASLEDLPFDPDSHVVFNDGSTGIYRQIVQYLAGKGYITLVKEGEEVVTNGKLGETSYDLPPGDWADVHAGHMRFNNEGFGEFTIHTRLMCPRGLRLSHYTNEFNPDGSKTRYLA